MKILRTNIAWNQAHRLPVGVILPIFRDRRPSPATICRIVLIVFPLYYCGLSNWSLKFMEEKFAKHHAQHYIHIKVSGKILMRVILN